MIKLVDLEKRYGRITAHTDDPNSGVSGVLALDGAKTELRLSSEQPIQIEPDHDGWFEISLRAGDGSLPRRLNLMSRQLRSVVDKADCKLLTKAALELRTTAAHGRSIAENSMPKIGPTVEGLAAFCALFDLTSCLMPKMANEHSQLYPLQTVVRSINYLRNLN